MFLYADEENLFNSQISFVGSYILYPHDLQMWLRGNTVRRSSMLFTKVKGVLVLLKEQSDMI